MSSFRRAILLDQQGDTEPKEHSVRRIGSLLREVREFNDAEIERIVAYQRRSRMRFGEAAVALGLADQNEVLEALSRQFQYTPGFPGREGNRELVAAADPFGDQAEAFRELRSRLLVEVLGDGPPCALAVASPDLGDGKTYLVANLAVTFSQLGESTLVIDADLRTPRQHSLLGIEQNGAGLSSALAGRVDPRDLVHEVPHLPNLYVAPAGPVPPNPLELLQGPRFCRLVRELVEEFDHVVVDTPAAVRGADSRVIAARCGAVLVVARRGRSRMAPLEGLVGALGRGPARIAGVVMNEH
jgi:protein-tyrosine kinase